MTYVLRLLLLLLPLLSYAQEPQCTGPSYAQLHADPAGQDVRMTCLIDYRQGSASGSMLAGGMIGGDVYLSRRDPSGARVWEVSFPTGSESTELSTLNALLVDPDGMIAGVGSVFRSGEQFAYLFRYDPRAGQLLYLREATFSSDPNTLLLDARGDYLVTGARLGERAPEFLRGYQQHLDRRTGEPLGPAALLDLDGDERLFDAVPHPGGGLVVTGQAVRGGGAGSVRTVVSRMGEAGDLSQSVTGFAATGRNARVFGYDVEVIDQTIYVLQWADLDTLTGSIGTAPFLSAFDLELNVLWTKRLDVQDYDGEVGIELEPHQDGLLIYGYAFGRARNIFLIHTDLQARVRWAKSYLFPGRVLLYPRANQQLLPRPSGIAVAATYTFNGQRSHEGLVLQLTPDGASLSKCVTVGDLDVAISDPVSVWQPAILRRSSLAVTNIGLPLRLSSSLALAVTDDCDIPCDNCERQSFTTQSICAGDSVRLYGVWRSRPGIYRDTLVSDTLECDSITATELLLQSGPVASYRQVQSCGLPTAEIRVEVTGGVPPYTYVWSDASITGSEPVLSPGSYSVTITDSLACSPTVLPVVVDSVEQTFSLDILPPSCFGTRTGSVRLLPAGSGSLKLLRDSTFTPDSLTNLAAGNYGLIVRTLAGCEVFRELVVPAADTVDVRIVGPQRVEVGAAVAYTAQPIGSTPVGSYLWDPAERLSCTTCPAPVARLFRDTVISLQITNLDGCIATDSLVVEVLRGAPRVFIPTAFSPNGDGQNDSWIPGLGPQVAGVDSWRVFDRWGSELWAFDPANGRPWTGGDAPAGVYLYTMTLRLLDGQRTTRSGTVTLVR
ncbi:hypothetical protein LEM8419_01270 [Neolewinella maritima]|uniref:Gliding motility-associated C-terminal domain-containing protein n=1 Tax=Neolewinella maritima TaxID=1383882 RepID=A0ABN8F0N3_9BACT|nr:gliding motility-associated C-terminal domain-containing protein [Neolewinella maritima]CAH1000122.1 hypothetical protein LEM8419_01270 [Neolewinella maritima]